MGRRLYVGNLAWAVTDEDLAQVFGEVGKVENAQVIIDRATNFPSSSTVSKWGRSR